MKKRALTDAVYFYTFFVTILVLKKFFKKKGLVMCFFMMGRIECDEGRNIEGTRREPLLTSTLTM